MLSADAEQLKMTNSTTPKVKARHTTVIIRTDSANHEFETSIGKRDERLTQEFLRGQECRARGKKIDGLRPTWDYPHLDPSPLKKRRFVDQPSRREKFFSFLFVNFLFLSLILCCFISTCFSPMVSIFSFIFKIASFYY